MDELLCPVCGQANPPESETCSNCGASLHAPIQPGQPPTKKHTSELEPILPDWLREAREKSREPGENEIAEPPKKDTHPFSRSADLLAGLSAQTDDEAEVPDWLADITGTHSAKKETPEMPGSHRVELGDFGAPEPTEAAPTSETSDPPSWLSDLTKPEPKKPPEDDLQDWFRQVTASAPEQPELPIPPADAPSASSGSDSVLDWLNSLKAETSAESVPTAGGEPPDWLKDLEAPETASTLPAGEADLSDWSTGLGAETPAAAELAPGDIPDWLQDLKAAADLPDEAEGLPEGLPASTQPGDWLPPEIPPAVPAPPAAESTGDAGSFAWLREMQESAASQPDQPTPAFDGSASSADDTSNLEWLRDMQDTAPSAQDVLPTPALADEPDWFTQASTEVPVTNPSETLPIPPLDVELPDWLKDATPGSLAAFNEEVELPDWMKTAPPEPAEAPALPAESAVLPDWLTTPGAVLPEEEEQLAGTAVPDVKPGWLSNLPRLEEEPPAEPAREGEGVLPALPPAELPSGSMDSLFTAMPDWLSESEPAAGSDLAAAPLPSTPTEPTESLTPANLPSWVQAMRPVEAASAGPAQGEETLETRGPLAGLHGVLPSMPYIGPANRPQAQSMRLNASNEQQNHGALLEQVLQAEIHPRPVAAAPRLTAQTGLRLAIGLLLFLGLLGAVFAGTQILPLPVGWPAETVAALQAVETIPAGSPVLVVFDYEPSLAGEMEAAAAPLLDHLIVRNHPALTLLSTSPTGAALAERMFAGPLGPLAYQDRLNLGYLPGGLGGVRSFVQDAAVAMPLAADSLPAAQPVRPYSEYSAILIITDSIDGGRTWIEQAGPPVYTGAAFVVISSAQAGPMLQPYYNSGQIDGLVSGLFDAAVLEQNNAGRPGLARRYWDAYNLGLALAVIMISIGGLWNVIAALRDRTPAEAE